MLVLGLGSRVRVKVLHHQSATFIQDLVTRYLPSRTLRSSSTLRLNPVNFNLKSCGSRAFAVSAPDLWNSLPDNIRSCDNLSTLNLNLRPIFLKKHIILSRINFCLYINLAF